MSWALEEFLPAVEEEFGGPTRDGAVSVLEKFDLFDKIPIVGLAKLLVFGRRHFVLVGAGLLVRSFWQLSRVDPRLRTDGLLTMQVAGLQIHNVLVIE